MGVVEGCNGVLSNRFMSGDQSVIGGVSGAIDWVKPRSCHAGPAWLSEPKLMVRSG